MQVCHNYQRRNNRWHSKQRRLRTLVKYLKEKTKDKERLETERWTNLNDFGRGTGRRMNIL